MTRPPLRLTRPGQLPAPVTGDDSLQILTEATDQLARLRTPYWLGDSAVHLHALTSLIARAQQLWHHLRRAACTRPGPTRLESAAKAPRTQLPGPRDNRYLRSLNQLRPGPLLAPGGLLAGSPHMPRRVLPESCMRSVWAALRKPMSHE